MPLLGGGAGTPGGGAGLSAYELAVLEGYEGTLVEWLESLRGGPGDKGPTGDPGPVGSKGLLGDPGLPGLPGTPGGVGDKGLTGDKGATGDPGATGQAGPAGGGLKAVLRKSADQSVVSATANVLQDVTDLVYPLAAGESIEFEAVVVFQSAAATTGARFAVNGPAGAVMVFADVEIALTATTKAIQTHTAYEGGTPTASVDVANTPRLARLKGVVVNGATAGDFRIRAASEVANSAITVKRGSLLKVS